METGSAVIIRACHLLTKSKAMDSSPVCASLNVKISLFYLCCSFFIFFVLLPQLIQEGLQYLVLLEMDDELRGPHA